MKLKKKIKDSIELLVDRKYISKTKHPTEDLYIYNYTHKTQFEQMWTPETEMCRGLILDGDGEIVARPFPKFFNYGERDNESFDLTGVKVYEKLDGSLGILYWADDKPCIATRGSFESDQAKKATEMIQEMVHLHDHLWENRDKTFLFEIIYPENRIVVDYGEDERLVLIAVIGTNTREEYELDIFNYPDKAVVLPMSLDSLDELKEKQYDDREGYVVVNPETGHRLKIKFDEYLRLHRLITGVSTRRIWEMLRDGGNITELLEKVPDEFYNWVKDTEKELRTNHAAIIAEAHELIQKKKYEKMDRKKVADQVLNKHKDISQVVFAMLDGKDINEMVWKMVKPVAATPFKEEI